MPSTASPYGLIPVSHPSGVIRPFAMTIASGYAVNIFQNQPVRIAPSTAGGQTEGTIVAAAVGEAFIGTFQGVEFTDGDGRRRVSNRWLASTAATDIVAYVTIDQTITYQVQSNAQLNVADIGKQYDFTAASGNTTTGLSTQALDVASAAANASLRLIGVVPYPNNAFGDSNLPFVDALVQISEHQNTANVAAY
jgi:hypothetical protein